MKNKILLFGLLFFALSLPAQDLKIHIDKKGRCGYVDEQGEVVIKCKYEIAFPFENDIAKVGKGGKFGFIDNEGEEVLSIDYDEIVLWSKGVYRIKDGDKYGLYSITDGILQKPQYSCISKPNRYGKAIIAVGGKEKGGRIADAKIGIVNTDGTIAIKPEYDKLLELKPLEDLQPYEIFRSKEKIFIGTMTKAEQTLYDARKKAAEKVGTTENAPIIVYGKHDIYGNGYKIGIHADDTLNTPVEYISCYKANKSAVVDKKGKVVTPFFKDCEFLTPTYDMFPFRYGTKKVTTGYYNLRTKKKIIIGKNIKTKKQVVYATPFTGDVALIATANADAASGTLAMDKLYMAYHAPNTFSNYLTTTVRGITTKTQIANVKYKYHFINRSGEKISDDFSGILYKGGRWVVINSDHTELSLLDSDGKALIEYGKYREIIPHNDGKLFTVKANDGKWGVIDLECNEVIPFNYSSITEPINGWYWATNTENKTGIIDVDGNIVVPFEFHNLFMNNAKGCTNVWGRKEANGLWCNYDIEKQEIVGDEVRSSSNFIDNYAWVVPQDQKIINDATHKALTALYLTKSKDSYGILIDREGNRKTTIPIPLELFPDMVNALNAHNGSVSPLQERAVIYKETRKALKHELSKTIDEEIWDF